jgi:alpha-glucosidase
VHSSQDDGDQEPWSFGKIAMGLFKKAVELRYQLLPYHYTQFYIHHKTGAPILRPLAWYDQTDEKTLKRDNEFLCGEHILTAAVQEPEINFMNVYLPSGKWYSYWNNELIDGKKTFNQALTPDTFPLYIKAGAIIPLYPVQQFVGEKSFNEITLKVYYGAGKEESKLYEDDHDGYQYENGDFRLSTFETSSSNGTYKINQSFLGDFQPKYQRFKLELIGFGRIKSITVDGHTIDDIQELIVNIDFKEIIINS